METKVYKLVGRDVVPCETVQEWAQWREAHRDKCVIANTLAMNGNRISTVFVGIPLTTSSLSDPPVVFETMVFDRRGDELDMVRYATLLQAEAGHTRMVNKWKEGVIEL